MNQEIDLRPYLLLLWRGRFWVIGTAVVLALLAVIYSFIQTPVYEAVALVVVTEARQTVTLDQRIEDSANLQPLRAYPELANSDEVMQNLFDKLDPRPTGIENVAQLRMALQAEAGNDLRVVRLKASRTNPQEASQLANAWAEQFVTWANQVYIEGGTDQLPLFEAQLAEAEIDLVTAEQALIEFQAQNQTTIVSNTLHAYAQTHAVYLKEQREIDLLLLDVTTLRDQLSQQSGNGNVTGNQLAALLLQLRAFNAEGPGGLQLQLDNLDTNGLETRQEQIDFLSGVVDSLNARQAALEERQKVIEPQILALQEEKQNIEVAYGRLQRNHRVAQQTYTTLEFRVAEERIESQDTNDGVLLASRANIPANPTGPRTLLVVLAAGAFGGAVGVFFLFLFEFWRTYLKPILAEA